MFELNINVKYVLQIHRVPATLLLSIVYAHEKALNYSISSAEDDKLLPKGR